jgi:hypothetical protein
MKLALFFNFVFNYNYTLDYISIYHIYIHTHTHKENCKKMALQLNEKLHKKEIILRYPTNSLEEIFEICLK